MSCFHGSPLSLTRGRAQQKLSPPAMESFLITTDVPLSQLAGRSAPSWMAGRVSHNQPVSGRDRGREGHWLRQTLTPWVGWSGEKCPPSLASSSVPWLLSPHSSAPHLACTPLPGSLRSRGRMTAARSEGQGGRSRGGPWLPGAGRGRVPCFPTLAL